MYCRDVLQRSIAKMYCKDVLQRPDRGYVQVQKFYCFFGTMVSFEANYLTGSQCKSNQAFTYTVNRRISPERLFGRGLFRDRGLNRSFTVWLSFGISDKARLAVCSTRCNLSIRCDGNSDVKELQQFKL